MKKRLAGILSLLVIISLGYVYDAVAQRKDITKNIIIVFRAPSPQEQKEISQKLQLTPEQNTKMKEVNERYKKETGNLKNEYNAAYQDVELLMKAEKPDKNRVNETLKKFHGIHTEALEKEVGYWMDLKTILTPAQNNKLWEIFEQDRIRK